MGKSASPKLSPSSEICHPPVTNRPEHPSSLSWQRRPHSDTGGHAVVFGINHRAQSAQDCCDRCAAHAQNPKNAKRPCNSWVFCPLPVCWGLDTGWNHTYGEWCASPPFPPSPVASFRHPFPLHLWLSWLKYQADPAHPLYGQRGRYSAEYRAKYRNVRTGAPSHVPWTGGVLGSTPDLSVQWTTGIEGMRSSSGAELTNWRYAAAIDRSDAPSNRLGPASSTRHLSPPVFAPALFSHTQTHSMMRSRVSSRLCARPTCALNHSAWEPAGSYEKRLTSRRRGKIN